MEFKLNEIAERIRGIREIPEISPEEMAEVTGAGLEEFPAMGMKP